MELEAVMEHNLVSRVCSAAVLVVSLLLFGCGGGQSSGSSQSAPSGTLDAGFGDHGVQQSQLDQVSFSGFFAVQPDGKIVATGLSGGEYTVARYNRDGSLDTAFGSGGRVTVPPVAGTATVANKVAVQSSGKIIMIGWSDTSAGTGMNVLRFLPDGTPDTAWGNPGSLIAPPEGSYVLSGIVIMSDDKVLLVGMDFTNAQGLIVQLNREGQLNEAFGVNGIVKIPHLSGINVSTAQRVEVQPDGKILIAGYGGSSGFDPPCSAYLLRLNASGTIDTSFGVEGIVTFGDGWVGGLALSRTGEILVSVTSIGIVAGPVFSYNRPTTSTLYRFTASGQTDASFGNGGMVANPLDIEGLVVDSYGRITVVGGNESTSEGGIARYLPSGALDTSFGGAGQMTLSGVYPYFWIATRSDGKVVVTGQSSGSGLVMMQYNP
jgi:uncharacterized delta-60 repeat protein